MCSRFLFPSHTSNFSTKQKHCSPFFSPFVLHRCLSGWDFLLILIPDQKRQEKILIKTQTHNRWSQIHRLSRWSLISPNTRNSRFFLFKKVLLSNWGAWQQEFILLPAHWERGAFRRSWSPPQFRLNTGGYVLQKKWDVHFGKISFQQ